MITRTDVVAHLERGMRVGFLKTYSTYTPIRSAFCMDTPSDGAFETYADMGAVPWPVQNGGQAAGSATDGRTGARQISGLHEGGPITVLGGEERAYVIYNQDWNIAIGIWHNAINDNRVGNLESWAMTAGARFQQHMDYLAITALNSGDGATYGLCYDGQNFFSGSHTDPGAEYSTAQDNQYTTALSLDNYETARVAASKYLDSRGQPCGFVHDLLIVPIDQERLGRQIVDNPEAYDTANREMNPYAGRVRLLVVPGGWLDTTAWYIAVSNLPQKPIGLQVRQAPQLVYWDEYTQGNGIRYYKWSARYVPFYGDWRLCAQGQT